MTPVSRREMLASAVAGAAVVGLAGPVAAMEPVKRSAASRMRIGLSAFSYKRFLYGQAEPKMTLPEFVDRAAKLGIDGVELTEYFFPRPLPEDYMVKLRRQCFVAGLDVTATAMRNEFTRNPGPERDAEIASCKAWIDRTAELGAPCIRIFAGGVQQGQAPEQALRNAVAAIEECCDYAGARGITLALENHGGIVRDADGVLALVRAVKSEWFGVNLDVGNFRTRDPYDDLARCAPYAVTVHFKTEVTPLNATTRETDYRRVARILRTAGYRGYVTLEYEGSGPPLTVVPSALVRMRRAFA